MKTALMLLIVTAARMNMFSQTDSLDQPVRRKTQISFSVSLQNFAANGGKGSTLFLVAPRLGFFVSDGLQIEPEAILLMSQGDPAYMVNGNLVYNFPGSGKNVPFLLAGYGVANTIPMFNVPSFYLNMMVGVLNLGVGLKFFVADNIAFRAEYRFQKFTAEGKTQSTYYYSYTQKVDARLHSFQFGIMIAP